VTSPKLVIRRGGQPLGERPQIPEARPDAAHGRPGRAGVERDLVTLMIDHQPGDQLDGPAEGLRHGAVFQAGGVGVGLVRGRG
jgi:hypothetical protein